VCTAQTLIDEHRLAIVRREGRRFPGESINMSLTTIVAVDVADDTNQHCQVFECFFRIGPNCKSGALIGRLRLTVSQKWDSA
jgi:hypothetical protein